MIEGVVRHRRPGPWWVPVVTTVALAALAVLAVALFAD